MKKTIFYTALAVITASSIFTSCESTEKKVEDAKEVAEEHNEAKFENKNSEKDAEFLVKAAEINLEEIELGKLAQQNSKMTIVKELGSMMEKEHTNALDELKKLAAKETITIPTSLTQSGKDACSKLNAKTGKDFDKEYCNMMVEGHKGAISIFEKASTESSDDDIKSWATTMLPVLRKHLDHAMTCQEKCKK